ncbi:DUF4386 domain-containing protein [Mycetocola miduiensis]|uniref:DUF4386 domain-containing protein n=1 Tax=Mycetocola miduiensis TaxID=995034 RepID=A0A1I4ZJY5_9MICO|nr:DUF4386 domain-containing protein [Mycetocola miduiensis]SFN50279.1 protein of unknown function [Mycetocola miduiensis]
MSSTRKTALVAGIFYLITFVSIPALALYGPVKGADFIISSSADSGALWGGFVEVLVALTGVGTAVTLFPVVRRQNESMALGFVASRAIEAAMIFVGVASIPSLVALRQSGVSGAEAASLTTAGEGLVAFYNAAFLVGQSLMPPVNAALLGTLLYRSRLVPRAVTGLSRARPDSDPASLRRYSLAMPPHALEGSGMSKPQAGRLTDAFGAGPRMHPGWPALCHWEPSTGTSWTQRDRWSEPFEPSKWRVQCINRREIMPDKSPHEHHVKKPAAKTLKEKRAEKHAKEHDHDMSAASDAVQEAHKADQAHKPDAGHRGDAAHKKH